MNTTEQKKIKTLEAFNLELQFHFTMQDERIKKLEQAIKTHQEEMENHWLYAGIDKRQVPDWDTNKKLWDCL